MSTIRQTNAEWVAYTPSGAAHVTFPSSGSEKQIRWGVPIETRKTGLGFAGVAPPDKTVTIQEEFEVGTIRHFNYPTTGDNVSTTDLELELVFDNAGKSTLALTFSVDDTSDDPDPVDDVVRLVGGFPQTLSDGDTKLELLGFKIGTDLVDEFPSAEGATNSAALWAQLLASPTEEEHCVPGEFEPVFNPAACSVPPICPISTEPIIDDCTIPAPPDPIIDCPPVDLPVVNGMPPGVGGGGGPGSPGPPGCDPEVTATATFEWVSDCDDVDVDVVVSGTVCEPVLNFTFKLCKPERNDECCWYKYCGGVWVVIQGGSNCGSITTSTTGTPTNNWVGAPNDTGEVGEVRIKCPCDITTSTTSTSTSTCPPEDYFCRWGWSSLNAEWTLVATGVCDCCCGISPADRGVIDGEERDVPCNIDDCCDFDRTCSWLWDAILGEWILSLTSLCVDCLCLTLPPRDGRYHGEVYDTPDVDCVIPGDPGYPLIPPIIS